MLNGVHQKLAAFTHPDFSFDAEAHTYHLGERPLLSFSTWIKDFIEPFDELKVAGFTASKRGCTVEQVLDEWQWSRDLGTQVHALIERFYTGPNEPLTDWEDQHPDVMERYGKFVAFHTSRLHTLTPLGLELQVFSEQYGLCGTIDYLGQHKDSGGLYVLDFKTNAKFSMNNGPRYSKMHGPFADLWNVHETKYSLQIAYYRLILEAAGIPTAGGAIVHLPPGNTPVQMIQAIDYRARVRPLLFDFPYVDHME